VGKWKTVAYPGLMVFGSLKYAPPNGWVFNPDNSCAIQYALYEFFIDALTKIITEYVTFHQDDGLLKEGFKTIYVINLNPETPSKY
jgi:hypothetical protein